MIVLKKLKRVINESEAELLESKGELERFLASQVEAFLAHNFSVVGEVELQ